MYYEVGYDRDDYYDLTEIFKGDRDELQVFLKHLRSTGAHHISAVPLTPKGARREARALLEKAHAYLEYAKQRQARLKNRKTIKP